MPELLKELTRYGNRYRRISDVLWYSSERTIEQYEKMRMYPVCWLGLNFIKLGLPNVPFTVECDEDEDVKLITEKMFKKIWERLIREACEQLEFGFKVFENRYEKGTLSYYDEDDNLETFEGILLKSPKGLHSSTIEILTNKEDGSFLGFRQDNSNERRCMAEDKKCLVFTHNLESGNYYGISALEPVYPYWFDANINRQFAMRWLERLGTGMFKGLYPEGATSVSGADTDNQDIMLDLLDGIMEGTHVALPSGRDDKGNLKWDIMLLEANDKTDPFIQRAKYIDEMILRGLIIPEKALTQGEVGARASIESFQSMFIQRKQELLDQIVDTIDKYLVSAFVELNFGPDVECHIKPGKIDDSSVTTANAIVQKLAEVGRVKVQQQWLMDKTGVMLEEEEEIENPLLPPGTPPGTTPQPQPQQPGQAQKEMPTETEEIVEDEKKKEKKKFADTSRWRALNSREKKFNMSQLGDFLDEQASLFRQKLSEILAIQAERIRRYIDKNYGILSTGKYVGVIDGIEIQSGPIRKALSEYESAVYDYVYNLMQSRVEGTRTVYMADSANSFIGYRVSITGGKITTDIETTLKYQLGNMASSGMSKAEMLDKINQIMRDYIETNTFTIAETELGFVLDKSNTDYFLMNQKLVANGSLPPEKKIVRYQYSAVLDSRVCDLCREIDSGFGGPGGLRVEAGSSIMAQYSTPIHYNCRCVWLPITQEEVDDPRYEETSLTVDSKGKVLTLNSFTRSLGDLTKYKTFSEGVCSCHK